MNFNYWWQDDLRSFTSNYNCKLHPAVLEISRKILWKRRPIKSGILKFSEKLTIISHIILSVLFSLHFWAFIKLTSLLQNVCNFLWVWIENSEFTVFLGWYAVEHLYSLIYLTGWIWKRHLKCSLYPTVYTSVFLI